MPGRPEKKTTRTRRGASALSRFRGGAALFGGAKGMKWSISVKGISGITKSFNKKSQNVSFAMLDAMKRAVIIVEAEAKYLIVHGYYQPAVKTGRLLGSVVGQVVNYDGVKVNGRVGTVVYYAVYVHDGTYLMRERKFLYDALAKNRQRISAMMAAAIRKDSKRTVF
ncbi:MAG: hypothetical protein ACXAC7_07945 [Candidatus Hodarchaeales archaeon]|jgi:hypothetical protein